MLEQGPLVGAGAVVRSPEGCGDWEFETGVQCLGGGQKLGRFVERLQLGFSPGSGEHALIWHIYTEYCIDPIMQICIPGAVSVLLYSNIHS